MQFKAEIFFLSPVKLLMIRKREINNQPPRYRERAKGMIDLNEYNSLFGRVIPGLVAAQTFTTLSNIKEILSENNISMATL